jgi:hypothetical protein
MKGESEIECLVRSLISKELDHRVAEASERLPHLCINNYRHPLDQRKHIEGESNENYNRITDAKGLPVLQTIGLCLLDSDNPSEWGGTICEEPIDAKKCPYFTPARNKNLILPDLEKNLQDPEWVQGNMPDLFILLWVLDKTEVKVSWWRKLLFRFKVIKVEPVLPRIDPAKLLTPADPES